MTDLEAQLEEAKKQNAALQIENTALRERLTKLEEQQTVWRKEIEEWRRGFRSRRKRFSSRGEQRAARAKEPKKRAGRRPGHPAAHRAVPDTVDTTVEHAAPEVCGCGGTVTATGTRQRVVVDEVPVMRPERTAHVVHEGRCGRCGKTVRARVAGLPAQGGTVSPVVLGPRAAALAVSLRFEQHLPLRRVAAVLRQTAGLSVSAGALSRRLARDAKRTAAAREEIHQRALSGDRLGVDETGWRQEGRGAWGWLLRSDALSLFHLDRRRSRKVFDRLVPRGATRAVLESDFFGVYTRRTDLLHAYCGAHLLREAKQAAEVQGDVWAASFARGLRHAYRQGLVARKAQDQDLLERVRKSFWFLATTDRYAKSPTVVRLQARMQKRFEGIVAFLGREDIPFTNNATERDLRPLCLHRKITGGTRSDEGSETLAHWMSVTQTLRKQNLNLTAWRVNAEVSRLAGRPVPSVFSTPNSAL